MKKIYDNCKIFHWASLLLTATVFSFALLFYSSLPGAITDNSIFNGGIKQNTPLSIPQTQQTISNSANNASVPLLNSRRNDNPPSSVPHTFAALLDRTDIGIIFDFCSRQIRDSKISFHLYLKHTITTRAGPQIS